MGMTESAIERNIQLPAPFAEGQRLGSLGSPIPQDVAINYRRYHELGGVHHVIDFNDAPNRLHSSNAQEDELSADAIENAKWSISGYVMGLTDFFKEHPGAAISLTREDGTLISPILLTVPANVDAYMEAYDFQRPITVSPEQSDTNSAHRADAGVLGFVSAATRLGVDVDRVPADDFDWAAFQYGMTAGETGEDFYKFIVHLEKTNHTAAKGLMEMNVLGREIQSAMQRAAEQSR